MLGKLIKNAFKANASAVYNVYIALGIVGAAMLVMLLIDWTKWGDTGVGLGLAIKVLISVILCLTAAVAVLMTFVGVFSEFRNNMYGKEGHLTLTLPVRSSSLILAKWISGSFWVILSYTVLCVCALGSFLYVARHSLSVVQGNEMYNSVYVLVTQLIEQLCQSAGIVTPSLNVILNLGSLYAFSGGVRACVFVLLVYFALTLAHCRPFNKLGKVGPVLYFLAGTFVVNTFATLITKMVKIYIVISDTSFTFTLSEKEIEAAWNLGYGAFSITNLYCTAVCAVFVFLLTAFLVDRKVNAN